MHVLNPEWVTNGIYQILTADKVFHQKGQLHISALTEILDQRIYPPGRHSFLLNLMRKFELCFSFSDDGSQYLIPELLTNQQPPEAQDLINTAPLCLEYHYPILPAGFEPYRGALAYRCAPRF